jgi:hypothetical protein
MRNFYAILPLLLLTTFVAKAQYSNRNVIVTTVIDNKTATLKSTNGALILNSKSGELMLKLNTCSFTNRG